MTEALKAFIEAIPHGSDNDGCDFWNPEPVLRAFVKEIAKRADINLNDIDAEDVYSLGQQFVRTFREFGLDKPNE